MICCPSKRRGVVVAKLDAELQRYWTDKRHDRDRDAEARYEEACNRVRSLGLNYVPAAEAALFPLDDILHRFETLAGPSTADIRSVRVWGSRCACRHDRYHG